MSPSESLEMTEMGVNLFSSRLFWLCVVVFPVTVAIPDFLWRTWQNAIFNSDQLQENSCIQIGRRSACSKGNVSKEKGSTEKDSKEKGSKEKGSKEKGSKEKVA